MEKNLINFFAERGFRSQSAKAKASKEIESSINSDTPSVDKGISDYKQAYQQLKLDIVSFYCFIELAKFYS